jgi:hypothetical protein
MIINDCPLVPFTARDFSGWRYRRGIDVCAEWDIEFARRQRQFTCTDLVQK